MTAFRWTNPSQPQTLQIAVFLLYFRAVFALFGLGRGFGWLLLIGMIAGAIGVANEKRWGYIVAVAASVLPVITDIQLILDGFEFAFINLLFDGALVALLLHPQSREYQRIWFS